MAGEVVFAAMRHRLIGKTLLPLNRMTELLGYSDVCQEALKKYEGREWLCKKRIPPLDCEWLDVVFLSPVHPRLVFDEVLAAVRDVKPEDVELFLSFRQCWRFVAIPIEDLDVSRVTLYMPDENLEGGHFASLGDCPWGEYCTISEEARALYRDELRNGKTPLYWARLWHVLYRGVVSLHGKQFFAV